MNCGMDPGSSHILLKAFFLNAFRGQSELTPVSLKSDDLNNNESENGSKIRHNLSHVLYVCLIQDCGLAKVSLPLSGLLGKNMALVSLKSLDLACAGSFETLCSGSLGLHFRHSFFLLVLHTHADLSGLSRRSCPEIPLSRRHVFLSCVCIPGRF